MNRTDQASEPSMEEILASIRQIISVDGKKEPLESNAGLSGREPRAAEQKAAPLSSLPEEDVLDLTDELVFAAEQAPDAEEKEPPEEVTELPQAKGKAHFAEPVVPPQAMNMPPSSLANVAPSGGSARSPNSSAEPRKEVPRAPLSSSRPIWSRREMPSSPAAATKPKRDQALSKPVSKNWAEDIQMPVPSEGPVPLIFSGEKALPEKKEHTARDAHFDSSATAVALGEKEEAKVAALVEKLARSAASAMDSTELTQAREVDFGHLNEDHKAEVTEKFANAIQREASGEDRPLPTLLDEVLRQEFIRSKSASHAEASSEAAELAPSSLNAGGDGAGAHANLPRAAKEVPLTSTEANVEQTRTGVAASQQARESEMPDQSLVQAQFVRASQSAPALPGGHSLEEAVREMLRPLLVQWLDQHMPRILETAIREEIATRGLFPKAGE